MSEPVRLSPSFGAYRKGVFIISICHPHDGKTPSNTSQHQPPPAPQKTQSTTTTMHSTTMTSSETKYIYITNLRGGQAIRADPNLFLPDDDEEEQATTTRPLYPPRNSSVSSTSSTSSRLSSAEPSDQE